jgi:hypothetical protein
MRRPYQPLKFPIAAVWKEEQKPEKQETTMNNNTENATPTKNRNRMKHSDVVRLTIRFLKEKDEIQKRYDEGLTSEYFAKELGIEAQALRNILNEVGIVHTNHRAKELTGGEVGEQIRVRFEVLEKDNYYLKNAVKKLAEELGIEV